MYVTHPLFRSPEDINGKIWQYMGIEEFVSMLYRKALFFVKASKLRDPYEGMMPKYFSHDDKLFGDSTFQGEIPHLQIKNHSANLGFSKPEIVDKQFKTYRDFVMINSWHYSEYESAAMWQLYSHENTGIAIESTFNKLTRSLDNNKEDSIWIGKVDYLDYGKDRMDEEKNFLKAFVIKRKSFEYEKEIRAVIYLYDDRSDFDDVLADDSLDMQKGIISSRQNTTNTSLITDKGKYVSLDLDVLIENIYVAPYAEAWFQEVVESLLSKYKVNKKVIKSDLYTLH
jgi:hypothetical protein